MNENELIVPRREVHVHFEYGHFVAGLFVQPNLTDTEHVGAFEKLGYERDDFAREPDIFRLLGIDAQPSKVRQPKSGGAARLVFG